MKDKQEKERLVVVIQPDNDWDNILCIASSMEAAAFDLECESVEELDMEAEENGWIIKDWLLSTLPYDTLEESIDREWG